MGVFIIVPIKGAKIYINDNNHMDVDNFIADVKANAKIDNSGFLNSLPSCFLNATSVWVDYDNISYHVGINPNAKVDKMTQIAIQILKIRLENGSISKKVKVNDWETLRIEI